MSIKKRAFYFFCACCLLFSLVGCGKKEDYFASPAAIYDVFSSQELGIARQSLLNYWQKTEEPYENAICVIRKGELERKTKNKKGDINETNYINPG